MKNIKLTILVFLISIFLPNNKLFSQACTGISVNSGNSTWTNTVNGTSTATAQARTSITSSGAPFTISMTSDPAANTAINYTNDGGLSVGNDYLNATSATTSTGSQSGAGYPFYTAGLTFKNSLQFDAVYSSDGTNISTRTITFTFNKPVNNILLNVDRLGGVTAANNATSAAFTLTTPGISISKLTGNSIFNVDTVNKKFWRTTGGATAASGETNPTTAQNGTAAGTLLFSSTTSFTSLTFSYTLQTGGAISTGSDRVEFLFEACITDTDGDGVADFDDLDDDNDGILDTDEGFTTECLKLAAITPSTPNITTPVVYNVNGAGSYSVNYTATYSGTATAPTSGVGTLPQAGTNLGELVLGTTVMSKTEADFMQYVIKFSQPVNVRITPKISVLGNMDNADSWRFTVPNGYVKRTTEASGTPTGTLGYNYVAGANDSTISVTNASNTSLTNWQLDTTEPVSQIILKMWSDADQTQNNISPLTICIQVPNDTDGDGIPNYLDTDSDNDGCPDAVEGGDNVTQAMLNSSGNIATNASGTLNGTNIATVDANGVPVVVNTGGSANSTQAQGQTAGTAYTSNPFKVGTLSLSSTSAVTTTTVCKGSTATLYVPASSTDGASFAWQSSTTSDFSSGVTTLSTVTTAPASYTTAAINATTYYRLVVTSAGGCVLNSNILTVNVNPVPAITNMTATICSANTFMVTPADPANGTIPSGTTYTWSAPTGTGFTGGAAGTDQTSISGTLTNTTTSPVVATYTVTPKTSSCTGATFTVSVTVNPTPTITGTTTLCANATSQLTGSGTAASTNPWTTSDSTVATVSNTGLVTAANVTTTKTATITYTDNKGCTKTVTITVNNCCQSGSVAPVLF